MAASSYLLELDQRREKLLSEVVDRLGIPAYSAEHEVATSFSARSLANHDHMDAEAKKVRFRYFDLDIPYNPGDVLKDET